MFYNVNDGRKRAPLHTMNSHAFYEKCRSRELLTSFNRIGLCISYKQVREDRTSLAKYAIVANERSHVPIQIHFSFNIFSIAALNNIDHIDRNSLTGVLSAHGTAMSLFQIKPDVRITNYKLHQE